MHTFSPCVLVSLRTLGVAWLSRKVSAKNDPIDCHEYSCNEGLFILENAMDKAPLLRYFYV